MSFLDEILSLFNSVSVEQQIAGVISLVLSIIFILELRKYLKFRSYPDIMELSGIGILATGLFALTNDFLLSGLAGIMGLMIIGTYEVRENPIWVRMMGTFTISYGFFFLMVLLGFLTSNTFSSLGEVIRTFLVSIGFAETIEIQQVFVGIGYNLIIWVLVITAFLLFGRKFIVVTRFISPQMTYLVLYLVALLILIQMELPRSLKYLAIFATNVFIYLISGPLLTFLYAIKPLDDTRVKSIVNEVQEKTNTPIRKIGIVNAPILNAFAFGPWFDQRIAYIASDLGQFTDSEIRGITAHELAHIQKKHTLILLGITAIELLFKDFIEAPASYWEFVVLGVETWDFLSFWILNMALFAVLLTFVKMLEGQADKTTREMGYGIELAESLYRLEGFYYGIAGEIGFNTQLMTGKERSKDENIRFMGDQAYYLYQNLSPSRLTCFMNLIASHPLTSIRIAMQIDHSIGWFKAGMMIWLLLLPGIRKSTIKTLQRTNKEMALLLSEKYSRDFGTIKDYLEVTYEEESVNKFINQHVLAKSKLIGGTTYWGKINGYNIIPNIVSPIEYQLTLNDGRTIPILKSDYDLIIANPEQEYFTKSGKKTILKDVLIKDGKFTKFVFKSNGKSTTSKSIGLSLAEFNKLNYWFLYKDGAIQPWTLKEVVFEENFQNSTFILEDENQEKHRFKGKDLIIDLPPQLHMIKTRNWETEKHFFSSLGSLNEPFILYDKEDFDIGAPTKIISLSDESLELIEGRTQKNILPVKLDAIVLDYPFFIINLRKEMSVGSLISLKLSNRGLKSKYIGI